MNVDGVVLERIGRDCLVGSDGIFPGDWSSWGRAVFGVGTFLGEPWIWWITGDWSVSVDCSEVRNFRAERSANGSLKKSESHRQSQSTLRPHQMALWKKSESHRQSLFTLRPHQVSHPGVASHPDPPSGVYHAGMAAQLEICQQPRLSSPQGLHYGCGASIAVFVFGTSGPCLCTPLRLWCRSISSVCLSSASLALRLTGATVAPPPHHRDSLLREVALSAQDGIPVSPSG